MRKLLVRLGRGDLPRNSPPDADWKSALHSIFDLPGMVRFLDEIVLQMKIDLQKDGRELRSYIEERIQGYSDRKNAGPGAPSDPIMLMSTGYYLSQTGYFALVFDTRPEADNDGEWTKHIENKANVLPMAHWNECFEHLCEDGTVDVTLPDGSKGKLEGEDGAEKMLSLCGDLIRDTVLSLREEGAFAKLSLGKTAFFIVEEFDGGYGWPAYEKRKTLGRLNKK